MDKNISWPVFFLPHRSKRRREIMSSAMSGWNTAFSITCEKVRGGNNFPRPCTSMKWCLIIILFIHPDMQMSCNAGVCVSANTTWPPQSHLNAASASLASIATGASSIPRCPLWSLTLPWWGWLRTPLPRMRFRSPAFPLRRKSFLKERSATPQAGGTKQVPILLHNQLQSELIHHNYILKPVHWNAASSLL